MAEISSSVCRPWRPSTSNGSVPRWQPGNWRSGRRALRVPTRAVRRRRPGSPLSVGVLFRESVFLLPHGFHLPRHGDLRSLALKDQLLFLAVVHQGSGDLPDRTVGVGEQGGGEILDLASSRGHRLVVTACSSTGMPHHPLEEVDVVDGVVHRAAAAFFRPCAAPPQVVVIAAAPPVESTCACRTRRAAPTREPSSAHHRRLEAVLRHDRQHLPAACAAASMRRIPEDRLPWAFRPARVCRPAAWSIAAGACSNGGRQIEAASNRTLSSNAS